MKKKDFFKHVIELVNKSNDLFGENTLLYKKEKTYIEIFKGGFNYTLYKAEIEDILKFTENQGYTWFIDYRINNILSLIIY